MDLSGLAIGGDGSVIDKAVSISQSENRPPDLLQNPFWRFNEKIKEAVLM